MDTTIGSPTTLSDHELVLQAHVCRNASRRYAEQALDYEAEIERRIRDNGGTGLPVEGYTVSLKEHGVHYDPVALGGLLDLLPSFDTSLCYTPAHDETIPEHIERTPDKWNAQQALKAARQYGTKALEIVASARMVGYFSLEIEAKDG